jgi:hypothetical protein
MLSEVVVSITDVAKIRDLLSKLNKKLVHLIINSNNFWCYSISTNKLKVTDIKNIIKNDTRTNLDKNLITFFTKPTTLQKNSSVTLCKTTISNEIRQILLIVNEIKLQVLNVVPWPIWLIDSYFALSKVPLQYLKFSLFVVKYDSLWEIIVSKGVNIICYRNGSIVDFDEHSEIEKTLAFVSSTKEIIGDDIAIYNINKHLISNFTQITSRKVLSVSQEDILCSPRGGLDYCLRTVSRVLCAVCIFSIVLQVKDIFCLQRDIVEFRNIINHEEDLLSEKNIWSKISDKQIAKRPIFEIIKKIQETTKFDALKLAKFNLDQNDNIIMEMFLLTTRTNNLHMHFSIDNDNYAIVASNKKVTCHEIQPAL